MVAHSASARFAPSDRPLVAVSPDGTLAAIHERSRIVVTEVPSCAQFAELGIDADAADADLAWVGTPPRLLVLSRYAAHSTIHLVDPFGPRTIAELRLESPMRLSASVGSHALAIGAQHAAVLAATDRGITPYQFPARAIPTTAGAAGTQFVVALPGAIEEWDPASRLPKRRLKLPRPAVITALGGSDRVVWLTTQQEPARIDVIPVVNRGQPKAHDLPEPIAHVASHPRSDLVACIGANSGRIYVIDLDGRAGLRTVGPEGIDRVESVGLVLGRVAGLLAAQTRRPLAVVLLEHHDEEPVAAPVLPRTTTRDSDPPPPRSSSLYDDDLHGEDAPNTSVQLASPPVEAPPPPPRPATPPPIPAALAPEPAPPVVPPRKPNDLPRPATPWRSKGAPENPVYAQFRDRVQNPRARTVEQPFPLWTDVSPLWRDEIAAFTRTFLVERPLIAPTWSPIEAMITRYDLTPALTPALVLLYGAHLLGINGVAPIDIARASAWPEALGRGELADKHVARYRDSRIYLAPAVERALDELAPSAGTMIGAPGVVSLLGPCTLVASGPLAIVAEACLSSIGGAILAADDDADPQALVAEARAYGAAPMLRATAAVLGAIPVDQPVILVADDEVIAAQLGVPRLT